MTRPALLELAKATLTPEQLDVWLAKHTQDYGRRSGSLALGISEEAWRHRLHNANRKMQEAIRKHEAEEVA